MKYSKTGTLYSLKQKGSDWLVVSFANPFFGKEVGKGSEAAMKAFYELLTDGGRDAVGFEHNSVQVVMSKLQKEILGRLSGYAEKDVVLDGCGGYKTTQRIWALLSMLRDDRYYLGWDVAKKKDRTGYSRKTNIPSQTKPSCELGKAQKDFIARLGGL